MPKFQRLSELPPDLRPGSFEAAVKTFVSESNPYQVPLNEEGFYHGLLRTIAQVLVTKADPASYIWAAIEDGEVVAFAICGVSFDVDASLTYWGRCAWVAPKYRRRKEVKEWFGQMREHAKQLGCKHFIVVSSRENAAYCRFLGKKWHLYAALLKEDLGD